MPPVLIVGRLSCALLGIVMVLLLLLAVPGEACNPTGNDPYRCWDICAEDSSNPRCVDACNRWSTMKNCPAPKSDEFRDDLPYSYPCTCFVNPEDDPTYDEDDNYNNSQQPGNPNTPNSPAKSRPYPLNG